MVVVSVEKKSDCIDSSAELQLGFEDCVREDFPGMFCQRRMGPYTDFVKNAIEHMLWYMHMLVSFTSFTFKVFW